MILTLSTGAPFLHPADLIYKYYPEINLIRQADISNTDSTFDILILSCSVLHKEWADIVSEMNKCIKPPPGYKQIKIYNASGIGRGSRDNLIKYDLLKDKYFDLVIYYDAINDARLNNCPDNVFKNDFSHYLWYDEINHIIKHSELNITVIPFFADWLRIKFKSVFMTGEYIPRHFALRGAWLVYGNKFKSLPCYKLNLEHVITASDQHHAKFLYLTFAYYLPSDYSLQKFKEKKLDYTFCSHSRETEIWGNAGNVSGFIDSVNSSSKLWIAPYKNASWFDLYNRFPKSGSNFADICHLSPAGIRQFAAIICNQIDSTGQLNAPR